MKIITLPLYVSMVGVLAALPPAYANEIVKNCTQVESVNGGSDADTTNNQSCVDVVIPFDYGDAPDPSFPVLAGNQGASHQLGTEVYLGQCVDADSGLLQGNANADDQNAGTPVYGTCAQQSDEDGVTFPDLRVDSVKNTVQVTANAACQLNAWIDWNGDASWGGAGEQVFMNVPLKAGVNALTLNVPASAQEGETYARFRCSTEGNDGIGGEAADGEVEDYKIKLLPAAPKQAVAVGDTLWIDTNQNGQQDKGESGLGGAVVTLRDQDGNLVADLNGTVVAPITTKADGKYEFTHLPEGDYYLSVKVPNGYQVTQGGDDADDNPSNTDSNCRVLGDSVQTLPFSLTAGAEPTDDGDSDANSNLSIDCGFYEPKAPTHSIGNRVWLDANNNGMADAGEQPAPAGIALELKDSEGNSVASSATNNEGRYLFSGLAAGDYQVCVAASNFAEGGLLAGHSSSTGVVSANSDLDGDDNGSDDIKAGLCTDTITLDDNEPLNEMTATGEDGQDGMGTADNRSNLTIDFGIVPPAPAVEPLAVGDFIWIDTNQNGQQDAGESGLEGAVLTLLDKDGNPVTDLNGSEIKPTTTGTDGLYGFTKLPAGQYQIKIVPPAGYIPTMGGAAIDDNPSNTDSNCAVQADGSIVTSLFTLAAGAEPTDDGDGANNNQSVDCGFYQPKTPLHSIGNYVWVDDGNGDAAKANNGKVDSDEKPVVDGVVMELLDEQGKVMQYAYTKDGYYLFSGLPAGKYQVCVAHGNFDEGLLKGYTGGIAGSGVAANVDNDNDGDSDIQDGLCSDVIMLDDTMPTGEQPTAAGNAGDDGMGTEDKRSNLTVDFAVLPPKAPPASVAVGDYLWIDANENGQQDAGESGLEGAVVTLLDKDGTAVGTVTTGTDGSYLFENLVEGDYSIRVRAPEGYIPTKGGDDADDNTSNSDNNCRMVGDNAQTLPFTLTAGLEPADDLDGDDTNSNLTVDCGFYQPKVEPKTPVAVGNQIWLDSNANGKREEGEPLLAGATVTLVDAAGNPVTNLDGQPVAPHVTGKDGLYTFSNLPQGEYIVRVEPPQGYFPTMGGIDADDDASDYDSNCRVNQDVVETHPFTLIPGTESTTDGDDANGNMTVDCGFVAPVALGNRIWLDNNANGKQDNAEPGIAGISVSLLDADGITPATDINGKPVAAVTTDANGNYQFTNLKPGDYIVKLNVGTSSGYSLTKGGADPDDDPSDTDSNCKVVAGSFQAPAITLQPGTEPSDDGDDANGNMTLDCGLFRPVNLGSRLWIDLDGNGKQDKGEPGVPGATVTLLTVDGKPVTDIFGEILKPQLTDKDGRYFFGNLREGDYVVKVIPPAGYLPTLGGGDPNDNTPDDSNGILNPDGSITSKPISLKWGEEPEDGGATNTSVGFGLIANLHIPTLSQWGLMLMSMLMGAAALLRRRRQDD